MNPISLFNPWVILALLGAFLGSLGAGYAWGHGEGAEAVQTRWNAQEKKRADQALVAANKTRATETSLQALADLERKTNALALASLDARARSLAGELSKRPQRPTIVVQPPAEAAGPGAPSWSTGAGLYRDDAMFLAGRADLWQRIRLQRDACYRAYGEAQEALETLSRQLGGAP